MIKLASRKTMVSNRNNIEIRYRHRGKYNAPGPRIQTYGRKKKAGNFNFTQVIRIATKDQDFNLEGR